MGADPIAGCDPAEQVMRRVAGSADSARVSVAMATFNGERFLVEQLHSIAAQSRLPDELVVTDDGSTDATIAILEEFASTAHFPVSIHRNPERLGYADSFIRAASLCQGDLIAFCDQDDVWQPQRLAICLPLFADEDVLLCLHSAIVVDDALRPLGFLSPHIKRSCVIASAAPLKDHFPGFATIVRRSTPGLFQQPRPPALDGTQPMPHDTWASILARSFGSIAFIEQPLAFYRRHQSNITTVRSHTSTDRVQLARRSSAEAYRQQADWVGQILPALERVAVSPGRQSSRREAALSAYRRRRSALEQRSRLYAAATGRLQRWMMFSGMVGRGVYGRPCHGNLGLASLLKDAACLVLPPATG